MKGEFGVKRHQAISIILWAEKPEIPFLNGYNFDIFACWKMHYALERKFIPIIVSAEMETRNLRIKLDGLTVGPGGIPHVILRV